MLFWQPDRTCNFIVSDFVQHLISEKKQLAAVRFIYAFELVDKFPPVPLLKAHLNHVKKVARVPFKKGKSSLKVQVCLPFFFFFLFLMPLHLTSLDFELTVILLNT